MPSLQIKYNRRSVAAQFDRFEREYPARVISRVMGPAQWGDLISYVRSAKKTRSFKNRTGNLRRNMTKTVIRQRALEVRFSSGISGNFCGMPYGVGPMYLERGTRHIKARNFWRDAIRAGTGIRGKLGPMLERETRRCTGGMGRAGL